MALQKCRKRTSRTTSLRYPRCLRIPRKKIVGRSTAMTGRTEHRKTRDEARHAAKPERMVLLMTKLKEVYAARPAAVAVLAVCEDKRMGALIQGGHTETAPWRFLGIILRCRE
jgi:hypothetical protein